MRERRPVYGTCMKCNTENSLLYEYDNEYWICKAAGCWEEEVERDSGRHEILEDNLNDYRRLVAGTK